MMNVKVQMKTNAIINNRSMSTKCYILADYRAIKDTISFRIDLRNNNNI